MTLKEISEERTKLVTQARQINDKAGAEKRDMTPEETGQFDKAMADADVLDEKRQVLIKAEARSDWLKQQGDPAGRRTEPTTANTAPKNNAITDDERREISWGEGYSTRRSVPLFRKNGESIPHATDEYRQAFGGWLSNGFTGLDGDQTRALQADINVTGGYLQAPMTMVAELLKFVDNAVIIRQKANVFQANGAKSLGVPSLDTDMDDADWTSELGTGNEDSAMAFGRRELAPHPLAKRIKVSNTLLRVSSISAESIVAQRLAYKHAISQEKGFMTGTGAQQPLGLFTASAFGISTGRDVSTDNTTSSVTADGLINAKFALKAQYQATGEWIFHRDAVKQIRKLKDGNGQYLWAPGLQGMPNTLLDRPVNITEYAPNTFTTGLYVGLFGDLKFYWIADNLSLTVQRLVELYAATNQTGFIGRLETDGMPVLEEAFARVKLA